MHGIDQLGWAHYAYLGGILWILVSMVLRLNVLVPSIVSTALVAWACTKSPVIAICSIFKASFVANHELFNIFLVIALVTGLLGALKELKADELMVRPLRRLMVNGHVAYFMIALATYGISLFFWPTPAIPLVGAVLVPAAIAAGAPPLMCAVAMAIAGQGMALSSDYVIGVAPAITANAAGVDVGLVAHRVLILSWVTGAVALLWTYQKLRRSVLPPSAQHVARWQNTLIEGAREEPGQSSTTSFRRAGKLFSVLTPLSFFTVMVVMMLDKFVDWIPPLRGDDGAALIGGTAVLLMLLAALAGHGRRGMFEASAEYITEGLVFAFRVMGCVLPIAGFFMLGMARTASFILGTPQNATPNLLFELVKGVEYLIPHSPTLTAFSMLLVGMMTGIDGSGFAGLPLVGGLSGALSSTTSVSGATLASVGQMGAVWTGGGTLIPWSSLIAIAAIARVPVMEALRTMLLPVCAGLVASTILAVALWG